MEHGQGLKCACALLNSGPWIQLLEAARLARRRGAASFTTMRIMPNSDGTPDGDLCFHAARGDLDGCLGAIQRGADVHYRRYTAFTWREDGESRNFRNVSSPILYAVMNDKHAAVLFLLDRGVSIETRGVDGATLLHQRSDISMARLLLRHGAHVEAKDRFGSTAIQRELPNPASYLPLGGTDWEKIKLLIVHGASTMGLLAKIHEARRKYESMEFGYIEVAEKRWREMMEFVESVDSCSPFEVAIVNGMHADATAALQLGHIDPACCLQRAAEIRRAATLSSCPATMALAELVLADWSPLNHHLYCLTPESRAAIKPVLLVANRLRADAEQTGVGNAGAVPVSLPTRLWTRVISFIVCRQLRADAEDCPEDSDAGDEDVEFDCEDDDERWEDVDEDVDEDEEFDDEDDEDDADEDDEDEDDEDDDDDAVQLRES